MNGPNRGGTHRRIIKKKTLQTVINLRTPKSKLVSTIEGGWWREQTTWKQEQLINSPGFDFSFGKVCQSEILKTARKVQGSFIS